MAGSNFARFKTSVILGIALEDNLGLHRLHSHNKLQNNRLTSGSMIHVAAKRKDRSFNILSHLISFSFGVSVSLFTSSTPHCPISQVDLQINFSEVQNQSQSNSLGINAPNTSVAFHEIETSFYHLGLQMSTDKVLGPTLLPKCLETGDCHYKNSQREECRPWGHWYHTLYQQSIGKYSLNSTRPFQFLEIGFHKGYSYEIYRSFFPSSAELHSVELTCAPKGKVRITEENVNRDTYS
jgi:hypothetical protein